MLPSHSISLLFLKAPFLCKEENFIFNCLDCFCLKIQNMFKVSPKKKKGNGSFQIVQKWSFAEPVFAKNFYLNIMYHYQRNNPYFSLWSDRFFLVRLQTIQHFETVFTPSFSFTNILTLILTRYVNELLMCNYQ